MAITLSSLTDLSAQGFDDIIDVRAPAEFADDHLPGAISLPVLNDEERARVGTIYKQVNPFTARKLGAALVARNAAAHLEGPLADRPGGWRPLVYCWRGGQRSGSFATILGQIGWRVETLAGGYKAWRGLVVKALYETPFPAPVVVLDGNTGTGKTEILLRMGDLGAQILDLEGLARHRGSLFGAMPGGQPSQRGFEGRLAMEIAAIDPARPVVVEAESAKIGDVRLPPGLWKAMQAAPRIAVTAPPGARATYLTRAYADLTADTARLGSIIESLRPLHPGEVISHWLGQAAAGDFAPLAEELMERHYDPRYLRHRARGGVAQVELMSATLDPEALDALAADAVEAIARL
jgi:tRNA 2-selenouridine synthase